MLKLYWQHISNPAQVELQSQYLKAADNINEKSLIENDQSRIIPSFLKLAYVLQNLYRDQQVSGFGNNK